MSKVRGPFIEYECASCGKTVQENAPSDPDRLVDRIASLNNRESPMSCASCFEQGTEVRK